MEDGSGEVMDGPQIHCEYNITEFLFAFGGRSRYVEFYGPL